MAQTIHNVNFSNLSFLPIDSVYLLLSVFSKFRVQSFVSKIRPFIKAPDCPPKFLASFFLETRPQAPNINAKFELFEACNMTQSFRTDRHTDIIISTDVENYQKSCAWTVMSTRNIRESHKAKFHKKNKKKTFFWSSGFLITDVLTISLYITSRSSYWRKN